MVGLLVSKAPCRIGAMKRQDPARGANQGLGLEPHIGNGNRKRFALHVDFTLLWISFALLYWFAAGAILWWAYDISIFIGGGAYSRNDALAFVAKMALILTVLTAIIWLVASRRKLSTWSWRIGWRVAWETLLALLLYCGVVVLRRQLWSPEQGNNAGAQFLPIIGSTNARFFAEFLWLAFLFPVAPTVSLLSGVLYYVNGTLRNRLQDDESS